MTQILLIGDYAPSDGGISVQMKYLLDMYRNNRKFQINLFSTKSMYLLKPLIFTQMFFRIRKHEIIHVHTCSNWGFLNALVAYYYCKTLNKKLIITYHGGNAQEFFSKHPKLLKILHKSILTVPSKYLYNFFRMHAVNCKIISNVISVNNFKFRKRSVFRPNFVSTRSLRKVYCVDKTILTFGFIQKELPNASLTIVGDGPEKKYLRKLVDKSNISNVTFMGAVTNESLNKILDKCDIFVNNSIVDNVPVSIIEAFACGLPVITTGAGGIKYMIHNNSNGYLLESNESSINAKKILGILKDQNDLRKIAICARHSVLEYAINHAKSEWTKLYESLQ